MLKRCTLLCLLLCCNFAMFNEFERALVAQPDQDSNQQPRYLREFFPFLSKTELSEDMKSLLTSLKRKKRVCHHGNKRGSHIVHFRPAADVRTLHFPSRSVNLSSVTKRALSERHDRYRRHINSGRYEDKMDDLTGRAKKDAVSHKAKRTEVELITTNPVDLTTRPSTVLLTTTEFIPTASPNQHPSVQVIGLIKPSLVPLVIQTQAPIGPTEVFRNTEHSTRPHLVLDFNPPKYNFGSCSLSKKREADYKPKKTIKSVITKILIIPVERQVEEFSDETAEEVDVVSLKHTRDNKKKGSTGKHKSTTESTTVMLATDNFTHTSATEDSPSSKTELSTAESTAKDVVTSPKPKTPKPTTKVSKTTKKKQSSKATTSKAITSTNDDLTILTTVLDAKENEPSSGAASNATSTATTATTDTTT